MNLERLAPCIGDPQMRARSALVLLVRACQLDDLDKAFPQKAINNARIDRQRWHRRFRDLSQSFAGVICERMRFLAVQWFHLWLLFALRAIYPRGALIALIALNASIQARHVTGLSS